ncbi:MAG TPA: DUF3891 family protein, partial [Flavisolibacter sp.]|nr:DUF3891 family protein [Flavisolibacter sp.]
LNFSMKNFEKNHCEKLAMLTITKSRYIALLTSMHMDFLYRKDEKESKEARDFLKEQRRLQAVWSKELGLSKDAAKRIYALLEWCDALSLLLCQYEIQPEQRAIEISTGPDDTVHHLLQHNDGSLTIDPWPFEENAFKVYFESRAIPQLQFKDSAEFRAAFLKAPVKETTWQFNKKEVKKKNAIKV